MRSFRARLVLAIAAIALVAIGLTTWAIAATTQSAIADRLEARDEAESEILEKLTFAAIEVGEWADAADEVEELAAIYEARIVLTDLNGRPLLDSGEGPLPEALTGVIDPFGPLAEFGEEFPDEDLIPSVSDCLATQGVEHMFDEFGVYVLDEADAIVLELCYAQAFEEFGTEVVSEIAEPAYLFVSYDVDPPVPWVRLGWVAAVVLGLAVGAALITGGVIVGPIRRLTKAADGIRGGDLTVRVPAEGADEIAVLAGSFNDMASSLENADRRRKQLTSDVAHELRSPVTNIIGHLDAVEDGVSEPTPDHLAVISSEAQRLHGLIEDLGQLAQADEGEIRLLREEQNVGALVSRAVDARRALAEDRGVTLRCDAPTAIASVDALRMEQVVGNLLDNAMRAVGEGGEITVDVASATGQVSISVADDGPGIPDELLDSVFDRLRRGDKARTPGDAGRGLGLAIARALVRAHGGDIAVSNRPEGGAQFVVTLPA